MRIETFKDKGTGSPGGGILSAITNGKYRQKRHLHKIPDIGCVLKHLKTKERVPRFLKQISPCGLWTLCLSEETDSTRQSITSCRIVNDCYHLGERVVIINLYK